MSSSEQAPEPTMDEILASIRKIISDDEPGESPQPEAAAAEQVAPAEGGLAEDLANALNDTQAGVEETDDILDLTQMVEDQAQAAEPQMEAPQEKALQAALGDVAEAVAAPEPAPAPEVAQGESSEAVGDVNIEALLAEAGVQDTVAEIPSEPQAQAGENLSGMLGQVDVPAAPSAEDASISEALSAMNPQVGEAAAEGVPDASMAESEPVAEFQPEPAAPEPMEASLNTGFDMPEASEQVAVPDLPEIPEAVEAEATAQEDTSIEEAGDMTAEVPQVDEFAAAEPDMPAKEPAEEKPVAVADAGALAAVTDEAAVEEGSISAEEQASDEVAEAAPAGAKGKTLEDSVKELLRPMLREWLDDNMERIVQDEVASGGLKGGDG